MSVPMATPSEAPTKRCHQCEVLKPISEFITFAVGKRAGEVGIDCIKCWSQRAKYVPRFCVACGLLRAVSDFDKNAENGAVCKACILSEPDKYHKACSDCGEVRAISQYHNQSRTAYKHPVCKHCNTKEVYRKNRANKPGVARRVRRFLTKWKAAAFAAYGGKCACCGETEPTFLTLDHVNNDGADWRRMVFRQTGNFGAGLPTYRWCALNGYPPIFQILCWNCQHGKRYNGGICPHRSGTCDGHPLAGVGSSDPKRARSGEPDHDMTCTLLKGKDSIVQ